MMLTRRSVMSAGTATLACSAMGFPAIVKAAPTRQIGLSLPLSGVQSAVGKEMKEAYELAIYEAGSPFKLVVLDDESRTEGVVANYTELCAKPSIVACSGIVGTPHAQAAAPIAAASKMPLVGIRSGARSLRTGDNTIWHLRTSFEEEISYLVSDTAGRGKGGMIVVYSDDSFGKSSKDWMLSEMKRLNVKEILTIPIDRDGKQVSDVCQKITAALVGLQEMPSIALLMITKPMIAATKELRMKHLVANPILAMSFTANTAVTSEQDQGLVGLGIVTAFPLPRTSMQDGPAQFRRELANSGKNHLIESLTAYEAWFYGKTIAGLSGVERREEVFGKLSQSVRPAGVPMRLEFDQHRVGYRYIGMAYKSITGKLRTV